MKYQSERTDVQTLNWYLELLVQIGECGEATIMLFADMPDRSELCVGSRIRATGFRCHHFQSAGIGSTAGADCLVPGSAVEPDADGGDLPVGSGPGRALHQTESIAQWRCVGAGCGRAVMGP